MGEAANYTQSIVFTHNLKPQSRDISLYELLVISRDGKKRGELSHVLALNNTKLSVFDRSKESYICQIMGFEFNLF